MSTLLPPGPPLPPIDTDFEAPAPRSPVISVRRVARPPAPPAPPAAPVEVVEVDPLDDDPFAEVETSSSLAIMIGAVRAWAARMQVGARLRREGTRTVEEARELVTLARRAWGFLTATPAVPSSETAAAALAHRKAKALTITDPARERIRVSVPAPLDAAEVADRLKLLLARESGGLAGCVVAGARADTFAVDAERVSPPTLRITVGDESYTLSSADDRFLAGRGERRERSGELNTHVLADSAYARDLLTVMCEGGAWVVQVAWGVERNLRIEADPGPFFTGERWRLPVAAPARLRFSVWGTDRAVELTFTPEAA